MKRSTLLEFESSAFAIEPGEDEHTNPGVYGKALAKWLTEQLRADGVSAGDSIVEDFGWCIPIAARTHKLYAVCANINDAPTHWQIFAFAEGGVLSRLFGPDDRSSSVANLIATVKKILLSTERVANLRESSD